MEVVDPCSLTLRPFKATDETPTTAATATPPFMTLRLLTLVSATFFRALPIAGTDSFPASLDTGASSFLRLEDSF